MKKSLMMATTAIAATGIAASAFAVDVELYGQVNKSLMIVDDGHDTEVNIVDNDFSSTRFGLKGSQALDNGLTASLLLEGEIVTNDSSTVTQDLSGPSIQTTSTGNLTSFAARHTRVGLAGDWGAVFLGHTSTATDGVAEQDLAGARDVLGSDIEDIGGGMTFRQTGATRAATDSGITFAGATNNMDGNGRQDVLRYDSPIFNGFQARVSLAQAGDVDGGVYYHGKYDEFAIKAGLGYVAFNDAATTANDLVESQLSGSVSVKHDSGLAGTVAYGSQELLNKTTGNDDPTFWYLKGGYSWDAFEVAVDYAIHEDVRTAVATDHEVSYMGVAGQYNLGNGASVAAYYRSADYDQTGVSTDELNMYGVNLRVKF